MGSPHSTTVAVRTQCVPARPPCKNERQGCCLDAVGVSMLHSPLGLFALAYAAQVQHAQRLLRAAAAAVHRADGAAAGAHARRQRGGPGGIAGTDPPAHAGGCSRAPCTTFAYQDTLYVNCARTPVTLPPQLELRTNVW